MIEPERHDFRKIIAEIEAAGISIGKLANMVHRHPTQMARWKQNGRMQHYEGQMLLMIHAEYVPRETSQNVTESRENFSMPA